MDNPKPRTRWVRLVVLSVPLLILAGCAVFCPGMVQRQFLFYPSHAPGNNGLAEWKRDGKVIGFSRQVTNPENVWLMLHGNAGQAADRVYAIGAFSGRDSVFILEYPGYGLREGAPSRDSINQAAIEGYQWLRAEFTNTPVCIVGESIGTGPACVLASQPKPPEKAVLIVPFDKLSRVASDHVPLAGWILGSPWDNVRALAGYKGKVEIFAAQNDGVIPTYHAKALAESFPAAQYHVIPGGHNDWSTGGKVEIRNR